MLNTLGSGVAGKEKSMAFKPGLTAPGMKEIGLITWPRARVPSIMQTETPTMGTGFRTKLMATEFTNIKMERFTKVSGLMILRTVKVKSLVLTKAHTLEITSMAQNMIKVSTSGPTVAVTLETGFKMRSTELALTGG